MNNRTSGCEWRMISVIIPVYNGEQYIEKTIESVMEQTYTNWELIIVDDCSSDNTEKIVKSIAEECQVDIENRTTIYKKRKWKESFLFTVIN